MAFLALVELLLFVFGLYVLVTQIAVPLFKSTALFPFFRRAEQHRELIGALEEQEVAALEAEIRRLVDELKADLDRQMQEIQEAQNVPTAGEQSDANSK